jgi:GDP-4-dehydro-6-deoxy-D-mannose reductase
LAVPARILVTGASGFVGTHLLATLRAQHPGATLLAASHQGTVPGADETIPFNLLDPASFPASLRAARPDAVVHLAAQAAVQDSFQDPQRTWRINVDGSRALAQALLDHLPGTLLVLASSAEVYGLTFQRGVPLDENAPMAPANPYAASKAAVDLALGEMALRGLRLVRLRPFNQVGPGQSAAFVVASFARQIARIEAGLQPPMLHVGALDRWRDFLDVRDVCAAYVAALERAKSLPPGIAINIASGVARRVGDVLDGLLRRTAAPIQVQTEEARLRPTDIERIAGDASLARDVLSWSPQAEWESTLDDILADWRARATTEG